MLIHGMFFVTRPEGPCKVLLRPDQKDHLPEVKRFLSKRDYVVLKLELMKKNQKGGKYKDKHLEYNQGLFYFYEVLAVPSSRLYVNLIVQDILIVLQPETLGPSF